MKIERKKTRQIKIGQVAVGGDAPVTIQSMTTTDTSDVAATLAQIARLRGAGCDIVRVGVKDEAAAQAIKQIKAESPLPVVADIHFDWKLAVMSIKNGADAVRINPGNIGSADKVCRIISAAGEAGIPIRIGANSGSVDHRLLKRLNGNMAMAMVESVLMQLLLFEKEKFADIKIALKSTSIKDSVVAYRMMSKRVDHPLHIGITEAGPYLQGTVTSAVGLGILLAEGIGDTLRVSLTADPVEEVRVGWEIVKALNIRNRGVRIVSCPTCARKQFNVESVSQELERKLSHITQPLTVSVLGCVVNGIGEGKHADIGIAGGSGVGILFKKGKLFKKVTESEILDCLIKEVETLG